LAKKFINRFVFFAVIVTSLPPIKIKKFRRLAMISLSKVVGSVLLGASLVCSLGVSAAPKEDVTYLLAAPPTLPAFGPWIIAKQKGYYDEVGLNVTFLAARGGVDVAKQIGTGNAIVGGAIGDTPVIVRSNNVPVKTIALLGGGSLTQIMVSSNSGIKNVKDLKGKTLSAMAYTDTSYYSLLGSLEMAGLTKKDVDIQAAGPAGVWQLLAKGEVNGMIAVPDWIINAREAGAKIEALPADQHFKSMAQAIIASDDAIKNRPETLRKLVSATLRGLKDIIDNPDEAAKTFAIAVPAYSGKEATLRAIFDLYRQNVYPGQTTLGAMDPARLKLVQDFYVKEGIVTKASPLDDLYTNQFVPR
jgi:NitT/TauT family transport system substrate-binding protein